MTERLTFSIEAKLLKDRQFEGYASTFGNVDLGGDVVVRGAFKRTLEAHKAAGTMPGMFWMHNPDQVAGVWKEMREDEKGLYVKGELADTQLGNEVRTLLKIQAVRGLSIGFRTIERDFAEDGTRLLKELELWEVSVVSLAMNPLAQVSGVKTRLSAAGEYVPTQREFELFLRDAGYSRKVALTMASRVFDDSEISSGMLEENRQRDAELDDEKQASEILAALDENTSALISEALRKQ